MRDVLDHGTGGRSDAGTSEAVINYGRHAKGHIRLYAKHGWQKVVDLVMSTDDGSDERRILTATYFNQSQRIETDREGRIVLPQRYRDMFEFNECDLLLLGSGDFIEIWKPEVRAQVQTSWLDEKLAQYPDDFDPLILARKPKP
jgi:MraZ protein